MSVCFIDHFQASVDELELDLVLVDDEVGEPVPLLEVPHAPAQLLVLADVVRSCLCTSTRASNKG